MATEQDHVWAMLDDILIFLAKRHVPTPERTYKLDGGWTLAMDDLRRFVDRQSSELATLRAQAAKDAATIEKLQSEISGLSEVVAAQAADSARLTWLIATQNWFDDNVWYFAAEMSEEMGTNDAQAEVRAAIDKERGV